jgi:hypothetical protein
MVFTSLTFIVFFIIVFVLYWALSKDGQNRLIVLSGLVFYGWWDWRFAVLLLTSTGFYTFQALSYTIDVYRRKLDAVHDPVRYFGFILFFPQPVELFRRHGFPVMDASETASAGMDDRAMSDGFHAEETFHLHVLKALLRDDRVRALFPGAETVLDRALAWPRTNYWEADFGS